MDLLIAIVVLTVLWLALKPFFNDDRKVMRKNTREYLDDYHRDKKPRQY